MVEGVVKVISRSGFARGIGRIDLVLSIYEDGSKVYYYSTDTICGGCGNDTKFNYYLECLRAESTQHYEIVIDKFNAKGKRIKTLSSFRM